METSDILQLGIMLSTAAALLFTVSNFRKQLQLNFFAEYTKRYQEIILRFPESINQDAFDFDTLQKNDRDITLRYMRAYFDLCSEEYFLWKKVISTMIHGKSGSQESSMHSLKPPSKKHGIFFV